MNTRGQIPATLRSLREATARPLILQRKCACGGNSPGGECTECRKKRQGTLQRRASGTRPEEVPSIVYEVLRSPGQPLDAQTRAFMEPRFGCDFGRVRVHTDARAVASAQAVNALAYTVGSDVIFGAGEFSPSTAAGRHLLGHELAHVVQQNFGKESTGRLAISECTASESEAETVASRVLQGALPTFDTDAGAGGGTASTAGGSRDPYPFTAVAANQSSPVLQRRLSHNVLDWDATKLGPPVPVNGADPRFITIPPTGQISVSALVEVNGDAADNCPAHEVGTTQTAWIAWTVARYRGQNPGDGHITVSHRPPMPMRDPGVAGNIWYDPANVRSPAACGDSVGIFHIDSPHHSIPKMRDNNAVAGTPLNYLRSYTRGLHLVTYLTGRDPTGAFLPQPLRFRYWNSIQDFAFTPNFANPLLMWAHTGQVQVNVGARGRGETGDAPYFTTAGTRFNDHFNTPANWTLNEQP